MLLVLSRDGSRCSLVLPPPPLSLPPIQATFKRYQTEHKMKQDSLERSQSDLKKLRRKSQGKNTNKYENKESEVRTDPHISVI